MKGTQSDDFEQGQARPGWGPPPQGAYPPPPPGAYPPPGWPRAPEPTSARQHPVLAVVVALLAAAFTVFFLVTGAGSNFAYDAGLAGTPGTYTATSCQKVGSARSYSIYCQGTFTSTDGSVVVRDLQLKNTRASVGHPVTLRREADGAEYAQPGFANATIDIAVGLAALTVLGLVLFRIGVGRRYVNAAERRRQQQLRQQRRLERRKQPIDQAAVRNVILGKDQVPGQKPEKRSLASTRPTPWRQIANAGLWLIALSLPFALLVGAVGVIAEVVSGN
ncbi:hypothetical protein ABH940_000896 [Streptacidiphilus sp. BW17]|uniref:hypothetical protein n=1 Tax=Streptacidiphilus sp. BW17 TaxID=3156274 RepID=UPI003511B422